MVDHKTKDAIRWGLFRFGEWQLCLAASDRGVVYANRVRERAEDRAEEESGLAEIAERELAAWAARRMPGAPLVRDESALQSYADQYGEYFRGERTAFTFPLDLHGTPFQRKVWRTLLDIPYGETRAYSDIAGRIGKAAAVRASGGAIGKNPVLIAVPCHRVIGKNGALTGFGGGLDLKAWLLEHESRIAAVQNG